MPTQASTKTRQGPGTTSRDSSCTPGVRHPWASGLLVFALRFVHGRRPRQGQLHDGLIDGLLNRRLDRLLEHRGGFLLQPSLGDSRLGGRFAFAAESDLVARDGGAENRQPDGYGKLVVAGS